MSERKVQSKYYPPDFDPSRLTRGKSSGNKKDDHQVKIRMALPMDCTCLSCNAILRADTKFNARKEATGEKYLNQLMIYRFYLKCPHCATEFTIKTDLEHSEYVAERGVRRMYFDSLSEHEVQKPKSAAETQQQTAQTEDAIQEMIALRAKRNQLIDSVQAQKMLDAYEEAPEGNDHADSYSPLEPLESRKRDREGMEEQDAATRELPHEEEVVHENLVAKLRRKMTDKKQQQQQQQAAPSLAKEPVVGVSSGVTLPGLGAYDLSDEDE